ncbi:kinase-like protein [Amniculicola lignicola CBS 123094]|uniref:non-specific serine/threonine protein kinase n=1 Tax=Amniculicola lignicola CBS 123094 TaxID=1392246 RepID=A0A6A5W6F0_9PLEO|nr:kinase-like protein [Amniculicola lignicola CBS 123094]
MESNQLQLPGDVGTKGRAIQQAKEMEQLVAERAKRSGDEPPPYEFYELIGKGSYGRVFKGSSRTSPALLAIKIIDIDKVDYEEMTTKNLQETLREITILQQLRDSRARPYVNIIEEALTVHNELWIISEYCSGGSVHTLMKPTMTLQNPGLDEKYIIPIARELALGLKYIHEAGVLHRDVKCNNVLISEEGRVQLCDFGVSGTLEPEIAKRSTIVGTPYWMAPELQKEWVKDADPSSRVQPNEILYGSEVDIWAYGCTLFEMATGFPPFHRTVQWQLPDSGVPQLEGARFSEGLRDLVAFVLEPNPSNRPTADRILEHPFLANTSKMFPAVTLVQLLERYYRWEQGGGARASLFNPYGAQAPDPLAPELEDDEDDDWTFSTTDEFEKQFADQFEDPFEGSASQQGFSLNPPPADDDRFAKLQATIREEQINRGKRRLDRLFDKDSTPYRYSGVDFDRPPSDLILRDFNPGAPNRETVIDLDFAAPTVADVPSIDLGEVPTLKANRLNKLLKELELEEQMQEEKQREMERERELDSFNQDQDQTARRATRDWKFPAMPEQSNRRTVEWTFPAMPEKATNRRTVEWTFDAAMAESNYEPMPKPTRMSRRETLDLDFGLPPPPAETNRQTRDFVFPPREDSSSSMTDQEPNFSSSPTLGSGFRPSLRHATTEPMGSFDDYPRFESVADSPPRTSVIDLDMANVDDYRPSTAGSASTSTYTATTDQMNGNPFDLEDQVHLSQNNNRASYHMKSQSEPNQAIPGLLTPQNYDEQGYPTDGSYHPHTNMHARGVSSASQLHHPKGQSGSISSSVSYSRPRQAWDSWSHQLAYNIDESPPTSISTDTSAEEEDNVDALWDALERQTLRAQGRYPAYPRSSRRTPSSDMEDLGPRSDTEDNYADPPSASSYDFPPPAPTTTVPRPIRVSAGPNGKPLVEFPVPRGPDTEALLGVETDGAVMGSALWKSTLEMRDGVRAARDLLKAMRLEEQGVKREEGEVGAEVGGSEDDGGMGTVRLRGQG